MLRRRYRDGDVAIEGNLEDYSFLIAGLLDLYEASFDKRWMSAAIMLAEEMASVFWDAEYGGFFLRPPSGQLVAIKEGYDGPTPSGNSVAALDLLRLAEFTGNHDFREMAETTLKLFADAMESTPTGYLEMLGAVDFSFGSKEVVVASGWKPDELDAMVREIRTRYLPTKVLALADGDPAMARLTEGKGSIKGMPTVYVCESFACKAPVTDVEALKRQLDAMPARWRRGGRLKATVLVDSERPKVSESEVVSILEKSGIEHSSGQPGLRRGSGGRRALQLPGQAARHPAALRGHQVPQTHRLQGTPRRGLPDRPGGGAS